MRIAVAFLALAVTACATGQDPYALGNMLPGKFVSLSDGTVFPAQAEISTGSGRMTALNPVTGETFEGRYTAILETKVMQHSTPSFWGDEDAGQSVETSDVAQASAVMVGTKGTVLNIRMKVKAGHPPTAFGDAEDNKGQKYNVQF